MRDDRTYLVGSRELTHKEWVEYNERGVRSEAAFGCITGLLVFVALPALVLWLMK